MNPGTSSGQPAARPRYSVLGSERGLVMPSLEEALEYYLRDNTQSWLLQADGSYVRSLPGDEPPFSAQGALLKALAMEGVVGAV